MKNELCINPITVGPARMMNVAGKMNSTSGKLIFTDARAAISSALYCRLVRKLSPWIRSAPAMLVPNRSAWISIADSPCTADQLGAILDLIKAGTISGKIAKDVFDIVWSEGGEPAAIVEARGLTQVTDMGAIEQAVDWVVAANPDKVEQAKAKPALIGWFVGQVMKATGGKASPQAVNDLLKTKLGIE